MEERFTLKDSRTVQLRLACEEDAASFCNHLRICGGETDFLSFGAEDCPYTEEGCVEYIRSLTEKGFLLLALAEGEVIGEVSLEPASRRRFAHTAELGIALRQSFCRCGLGRELMEQALAFADGQGLDSVNLTASSDNAGAIRLYESVGFRVYGRYERQSFYSGAYHDTLLMVRYRR